MAAKKAKGTAKGAPPASPMDAWISRARGIGAILGFLIAFQVCRGQGFATSDAILRGLAGAVVMSLVAWWSALLVIQALMRSAAAQTHHEAQLAAARAAVAAQEAEASFGRRPSDAMGDGS